MDNSSSLEPDATKKVGDRTKADSDSGTVIDNDHEQVTDFENLQEGKVRKDGGKSQVKLSGRQLTLYIIKRLFAVGVFLALIVKATFVNQRSSKNLTKVCKNACNVCVHFTATEKSASSQATMT